jgi:DNA-binding FadR family transcriptional regulator
MASDEATGGTDRAASTPFPPTVPAKGVGRRGDKVSQVVARHIVRDIVAQDLPPGSVLPSESIMLERFGVGRASLREALRILEVQGLITIKPGPRGGPVVAAPTHADFGRTAALHLQMVGATFRELVEARLILEPLMARQAAERQDPEFIDALRISTEELTESADSQFVQIATDFHGLMASASGNRVLDQFGGAIKEMFYERVGSAIFPTTGRGKVDHDHREIYKAIEKGKPALAERLMREHMQAVADQCEQRYPGLLDEIVDWR